MNLLIAVGSRQDRVCSIGAFARAEALALKSVFKSVKVLEPDQNDCYPVCDGIEAPHVIFFHAPALHDRKRPWNAISSALKLKAKFPKARFFSIVHELSEAPSHWKMRQWFLVKMSHGVIVNSQADYDFVKTWHKRVLRTHLGPTLFFEDLLQECRADDLKSKKEKTCQQLGKKEEKWILHPGLLTPGKGINFLSKLIPSLDSNTRLIVMGGMGPKQRDRDFAQAVLRELSEKMKGRFTFVDSPDDSIFKDYLLAADLVVLPYDAGLSERRSSFLSSMCCGANVWTTVGSFTLPLAIENTGVHQILLDKWQSTDSSVFSSITEALNESEETQTQRRLRNLKWATNRSWKNRVLAIQRFINSAD